MLLSRVGFLSDRHRERGRLRLLVLWFLTGVFVLQHQLFASETFPGSMLATDGWELVIGADGPEQVSFHGTPVLNRSRVVGYEPNWSSQRFSMGAAEIIRSGTSVTWKRAEMENQVAELGVRLVPHHLRLCLSTTVWAPGPTEFSLKIAPEGVWSDQNRCVVWVNGRLRVLDLNEAFNKIRRIHELRFETPTRTVRFRCDGFELQDRRSRGQGFFLVRVIGSDGNGALETESEIEITVVEGDPAMREGRKRMLSQNLRTRCPIPLGNAGFESESPCESWEPNPLVEIDAEIRHEGKQSARLSIDGEVAERGHVYIVKHVPVQERRLYQARAWVRTEDVVSASVGGMPSVGATVILEFADKEDRWFAPGSYAPGVYGTTDWKLIETDVVRAPRGTGYAVLFLALRANGTAWFDDVSLESVEEGVFLVSPIPQQQVLDNTPRFEWYYEKPTFSTLELSPSPLFPGEETTVLPKLEEFSASVSTPIDTGQWFWRVLVPDRGLVSDVWNFQQTALSTQDTTEPLVGADHRWLADAGEALLVSCSDNVGVTRVSLRVDGRDESSSVERRGEILSCQPARGWDTGYHKISVTAEDAAGNISVESFFVTHSRLMDKKAWSPRGGVEIDGGMHFPLAMYGVRIEDMSEIAGAGFDLVHNYRWDGSGTNEEALEYLDAAESCGLCAFIGFSRERLMDCDEDFVARRVGALMEHPALFGWYLYDEPDIPSQYVSPVWLSRYYRLIKKLDPFHPVIVTCAHDDSVCDYRHAYDVHWTQVYNGTRHVAGRLENHRSLLGSDACLLAILPCFDRDQTAAVRGGSPADPSVFHPDGRRMRADAFMALAHDSSGLAWWWWGQGSDRYFTVRQAPEAWKQLQQIVADIRSLRPTLTSHGEIESSIERPPPAAEIHIWKKKAGPETTIIAVNPTESECEIGVGLPECPETMKVEVLFEERSVEIRDGVLSDRFQPLDVHVYRFHNEGETKPGVEHE
jgi:hypothetical protein